MLIKYSEYMAHSWEEYSSQGENYKKIEDWWKDNWKFVNNASSSDYDEWTNWYMTKYYNEWNNVHHGPEATLNELKKELTSNNLNVNNNENRGERIKDRFHKIKDIFVENFPIGDWPNKNNGINFLDLSKKTQDFLRTITGIADKLNLEKPHVTSGYRSPSSQARVMSNNWAKNGGKQVLSEEELRLLGDSMIISLKHGLDGRPITKGAVYLYKLYSMKSFAFFVNNTLYDYGINRESRRIISEWIESNVPLSSHMGKPATSVDLRLTDGIKKILDIIKKSNKFDIKILYEGDHYHVRVND